MKTLCGIAVGGLVLLLTAASVAAGESVDGQKLLRDCQANIRVAERTHREGSVEVLQAAFCAGYVLGVADLHGIETLTRPALRVFCLPETWEVLQGIRVVVRYLQTHPEQLHLVGATLVYVALHEAFPCPPAASQPQR
jgi:hypothetical protein